MEKEEDEEQEEQEKQEKEQEQEKQEKKVEKEEEKKKKNVCLHFMSILYVYSPSCQSVKCLIKTPRELISPNKNVFCPISLYLEQIFHPRPTTSFFY